MYELTTSFLGLIDWLYGSLCTTAIMLWQDLFVELSRIKMANGECITKNIIAGQKNIADPKLLLIHDMDYDAGNVH